MEMLEYLMNAAPMLGLFAVGGVALQYTARAFARRHQDDLARLDADMREGRVELPDNREYGPLDLELDNPWNLSTSSDE